MTTIQPPSSHPREISVTEALEPAYDRVKQMLFKPFDLTKWIVIGFCAWLAGLGESGGGGGFNGFNGGNSNNFNSSHGQPAEQLRHVYQQAREYVVDNFYWIIPVTIIVLLLVLALWVLIVWLSSRGKFMFLHCVALNTAEVEAPWRMFSGAANSLFWFRLVVGLIGLVLMLPLLGLVAFAILQMVLRGEPNAAGVLTAIGLGLVFFGLCLVFALIHKFTMDFVVPIMFLRRGSCLSAWREFKGLLTASPGQFVLYILFQIVLAMAIGAIVVLMIVVTCCIAGCLMALPFVGTVLLLPVLVFKQAYPLYYLAQFGPQYNVFPPPPAPLPSV